MPWLPTHPLGWFFCGMALLGTATTCNTFYPARRPLLAMLTSFFFGWIVSELAPQIIIGRVLLIVCCLYAGVLSSISGWIALALMLVSIAGLVAHQRLALQAKGICERAVAELSPAPVPRMAASLLALPFPVRHPEVERVRNVTFFQEGPVELKLDVIRHRSRPTKCPTLVFVHGGAWVIGHRQYQGLPMLHQLAALGWVCVSIDYRLSPKATFPDHLIDVKRALRWVKEEGAAWGIDPDFVLIAGNSAGAHLATLAALTSHDRSYQPGFPEMDCSVRGCISLYGVYDFVNRAGNWGGRGPEYFFRHVVMKVSRKKDPDAWDRASPICRITPDAPPHLVIQGDRDVLVWPKETRRFCDAFRATARAPLYYIELPGAQHAFDTFPSVRTAAVVEAAARFAEHLRRQYAGERELAAARTA